MYRQQLFIPRRVRCRAKERVFQSFKAAAYVYNNYGWISSDFAELNKTNDQLAQMRILSRMQELPSDETDGKTVREIAASIKSRYCQTPAELDRFEQFVIENALDYYKSVQDKAKVTEASASTEIDSDEKLSA